MFHIEDAQSTNTWFRQTHTFRVYPPHMNLEQIDGKKSYQNMIENEHTSIDSVWFLNTLPFLAMMVKLWCPVSSSRNPPLYVTGALSSLSCSDASLLGNVFTAWFCSGWAEPCHYHSRNHVLKSLAAEMYSTSTLASGPNHFWMWIRWSTRRSFLTCCLNESSVRLILEALHDIHKHVLPWLSLVGIIKHFSFLTNKGFDCSQRSLRYLLHQQEHRCSESK